MVDSQQRYVIHRSLSGAEVARIYWSWLNQAWGPLVRVRQQGHELRILLLGVAAVVLEQREADAFVVRGGALARPGGDFRFSAGPQGAAASLTGFIPRLPLWLYRISHGPMHQWTMARFGRHLSNLESPR